MAKDHNDAYAWQGRGLAGLVTMLETEARQDARVLPAHLDTLQTWADRLRAVIARLRAEAAKKA